MATAKKIVPKLIRSWLRLAALPSVDDTDVVPVATVLFVFVERVLTVCVNVTGTVPDNPVERDTDKERETAAESVAETLGAAVLGLPPLPERYVS